jgi:hypothetical protein
LLIHVLAYVIGASTLAIACTQAIRLYPCHIEAKAKVVIS